MKKLTASQLIGQRGEFLVAERAMAIGFAFDVRSRLETGVDGMLELRDPKTGRMLAQWIGAQPTGTGAFLLRHSFPANSNQIRSHTEALGSSTQIRSCVSLWYCAYRVTAKSTSRIARTIQMLMRIKALLWS
jgi:hypothetical protein